MAIAFSDYLLGQRGRDDAVGGLARDAAGDPEWPRQRGLSFNRLRNYLLVNHASQGTLDGLERALERIRRHQSRRSPPCRRA